MSPRQPLADWSNAEVPSEAAAPAKAEQPVMSDGSSSQPQSGKHLHTPLLQAKANHPQQGELDYVDYSARALKKLPADDQPKSWKRRYLNLAVLLLLLVGGYLCYLALSRWYA